MDSHYSTSTKIAELKAAHVATKPERPNLAEIAAASSRSGDWQPFQDAVTEHARHADRLAQWQRQLDSLTATFEQVRRSEIRTDPTNA